MTPGWGCACGIDVHAHVVPEHFPAYLGSKVPSPWPSTTVAPEARGLCHRHVLVAGKHYRTVSEQCWSTPRRLADLPQMGLSHQVVSPMPELLSYWLEPADAAPLIGFLNEQTAAMCALSQGRLLGLAAVPLQDIDAAIAELRRAREQLGLVGVEIGSNVNGRPIGDAAFDAFYEACVGLDLPVFVHALRPAGLDRLVGPSSLEQVLGYPTDVGLAAASVITGGLLQRHPRLRIAFSHGAGTLGAMLPRLQHAWNLFPALQALVKASPTELARTMFVDDLVYGGQAIRHLVDVFGTSQVMLGSDYPFAIQDPDPLGRVQALALHADEHDALTRGNALRWLDGAGAQGPDPTPPEMAP